MEKRDFKKELSSLYKQGVNKRSIIDVPSMQFLRIDGAGDPNTSQSYKDAIEALYAVSYALKFMVKKGDPAIDYGVMPLEGLWWSEDMHTFSVDKKDEWLWTMQLMQPEFITNEMVADAIESCQKKKKLPALDLIRFEEVSEGKAAQILHVGPFSEEQPTIERLHTFIADEGFERRGTHHEIYLSDIRRAAPEKWKTIIRQPVE